MYPDEGEIITCEYCLKETMANQDMEDWIAVSKVKAGQETPIRARALSLSSSHFSFFNSVHII